MLQIAAEELTPYEPLTKFPMAVLVETSNRADDIYIYVYIYICIRGAVAVDSFLTRSSEAWQSFHLALWPEAPPRALSVLLVFSLPSKSDVFRRVCERMGKDSGLAEQRLVTGLPFAPQTAAVRMYCQ